MRPYARLILPVPGRAPRLSREPGDQAVRPRDPRPASLRRLSARRGRGSPPMHEVGCAEELEPPPSSARWQDCIDRRILIDGCTTTEAFMKKFAIVSILLLVAHNALA